WQNMLAIDHDDKARLFTSEELLYDDTCAGATQFVVCEHGVDRGVSFIERHGDHHAFPGSKAICLDDDGSALLVDIIMGSLGIGERGICRSRDTMSDHERLGEIL